MSEGKKIKISDNDYKYEIIRLLSSKAGLNIQF